MKRFLLLAFSSVLFLTACGPFKAPSVAGRLFLDTLQTDADAAYEMTGEEFKAVVPQSMFDEFLSLNPQLMQIEETKFNSWHLEGGLATLGGNMTFEDGTTGPLELMLVKEADGEWRLYNMDLAPVQEEESSIEEAAPIEEPVTEEAAV